MDRHSQSPTIASACTGYGGLDMAVELVLGPARHLWHAETNPNAAKILEARFPGVPNLGDITRITWADLATGHRPEVTTAGWPCQPFSASGLRRGTADHRHLWPYLEDYLYEVAPPVFAGENVPNLLTIEHGTAFGRILADLNRAGYSARWTITGACHVGACHHRHRVILVAARIPWTGPPRRHRRTVPPLAHLVMDAEWLRGDGRVIRWPNAGTMLAGRVWADIAPRCDRTERLLPTPRARDSRGGDDPAAHAARVARGQVHVGHDLPTAINALTQADQGWGMFTAAVARHTALVGRPAPDWTVLNRYGAARLNPRLSEWMMCLPAGWVTDVLPLRTHSLTAIGNGVNPLQVAAALRGLGLAEAYATNVRPLVLAAAS